MAELLLELLSEEIPARMQARAVGSLGQLIVSVLPDKLASSFSTTSYYGPRRIAVVSNELPLQLDPEIIERKGPLVGVSDQQIAGFRRSLEGKTYTLTKKELAKGLTWVARIEQPARPMIELLSNDLPQRLWQFPWPKSMRWGSRDERWVRPLQGIVCLLDGKVVPFTFAGVESDDVTLGHRFMAPAPLRVSGFADYREKLRLAKVVLDPDIRRRMIVEGADQLAAGKGLRVRHDPGLLDELVGLVEWPVPLLGRIDPDSMGLPPEVLTTSMRTHQRYLALEDGIGRLAPFFVTVANIEATDGGAAIVAGNERVLRARLWDARFFWEQDRKVRLEDRLPALDATVFHEKLGSLGDKVRRLLYVTPTLADLIPGGHHGPARRAAELCKGDLKTGMVGEFPELQGLMGGYYARAQEEPEAVAIAIAAQYAPKGPSDQCPSAPTTVALAMADKIDTLVGFFAVGIRPTGSGDPFALRRAALGVIRLIVENGLRLPLAKLFITALNSEQFRVRFIEREKFAARDELLTFFAERLKVYLRERGVRHDQVAAVFATGDDDLVRIIARVDRLAAFLGSDDGRDLLAGYRRASSIVAIEEKRDGHVIEGEPEQALLVDPEETALHGALAEARSRIGRALADEDYEAGMVAVAALRAPIDAFFNSVMVNAAEPEVRVNRLRLLGMIRSALGSVADFGLIEDSERGRR